jgi:Flp pilus assembly protein TadB
MKKLIALVASIVFSLSVAGFAVAQAPAPKAEDKKMDKMEKMEKKETRASCLKMAKDDKDKRAECEKKFAKKPAAKKPADEKK